MKIFWLAGLVTAAVLAAQAYGDGEPTTMNEAAVRALAKAYSEHPHAYEYGGVIVKMPSGKFNASLPATDGHADNLDINEDPEAYDGHYPVVADYHTHPCIEGYVPGVFSPQDLKGMRESTRPGYILDECTGDVHYWAPGDGYDSMVNGHEVPFGIKVAAGKVVGHVPVDGAKSSL